MPRRARPIGMRVHRVTTGPRPSGRSPPPCCLARSSRPARKGQPPTAHTPRSAALPGLGVLGSSGDARGEEEDLTRRGRGQWRRARRPRRRGPCQGLAEGRCSCGASAVGCRRRRSRGLGVLSGASGIGSNNELHADGVKHLSHPAALLGVARQVCGGRQNQYGVFNCSQVCQHRPETRAVPAGLIAVDACDQETHAGAGLGQSIGRAGQPRLALPTQVAQVSDRDGWPCIGASSRCVRTAAGEPERGESRFEPR